MLRRSRSFRTMLVALALSLCISIGVSAKTVSDSYTGDINISMSTDGYFSTSTDKYSDGKLLISYKYGESQGSMEYPKYTFGTTVKYYNEDGSFNHEKVVEEGASMFSPDYSDWITPNNTVDVSDSSDYNMASGETIIHGTKPKTGENWFWVGSPFEKGYVEITAVYEKADGSFSTPVSKVFYFDSESLTNVSAPTLTISEKDRVNNSVTLVLGMKTQDASSNLAYVLISKPDGSKEEIVLSGAESSKDYKVIINGDYKFKVYSNTGQNTEVVWAEKGMTSSDITSEDILNAEPPKLTFSNIPESQQYDVPFLLKVTSDTVGTISSDGVNYTDVQEIEKEIVENGVYSFTVVGNNGKSADFSIEIDCFGKAQQGEAITDIAKFWGSVGDTLGEEVLPQTGGISLGYVITLSAGLIAVGLKLILGGRKRSVAMESVEVNDSDE